MVDGILNINKPSGMSSNKCMQIVKRKLGLKKVGFLGTLDPAACGVLVLLCGKYTKWADYLHGRSPHPEKERQSTSVPGVTPAKVYRSVFSFGIETTTLDLESEVTEKSDVIPTHTEILEILPKMIGEIEIQVPRYSAVHINGKRAYDLARRGVDFEPPKKQVRIERFELLNDTRYLDLCRTKPLDKNEFYFEIECQTGTYIRSLAKLVAEKLGTLAVASSIIRTAVGGFQIKDSKSPDDVTLADLNSM